MGDAHRPGNRDELMEKARGVKPKADLSRRSKETRHVLAAISLAKIKLAATPILCMTLRHALPSAVD